MANPEEVLSRRVTEVAGTSLTVRELLVALLALALGWVLAIAID